MRSLFSSSLAVMAMQAFSVLAQQEKPLPPVAQLQATALANYTQMTAARERYLCRERNEGKELDSKGRVTKVETTELEIFFVHGFSISQQISHDGKPLTEKEQKKQREEVAKAIAKAQKETPRSGQGFSARDVLKYGTLVNERRLDVAGRPTIVFDVAPSDDKGGPVEAKIIHAMRGTISIDEASGRVQDINATGERDVKVGGGVLANIHKGFRIHILATPLPDGVWMVKLVEGRGDARIGLFMNKGAEFRQETESCRPYDVSTEEKVPGAP